MKEPREFDPSATDFERCGLYTPGHQVHFIQARLAGETDPAKYRVGRLVSVDDDGWIAVEVQGEALSFWNHDPARARICFMESGGRVGLPEHGLLHAPCSDACRYCICVTTDHPTPCVPPPAHSPGVAGLAERLVSHGGVMVSGQELRRILRDADGPASAPDSHR